MTVRLYTAVVLIPGESDPGPQCVDPLIWQLRKVLQVNDRIEGIRAEI